MLGVDIGQVERRILPESPHWNPPAGKATREPWAKRASDFLRALVRESPLDGVLPAAEFRRFLEHERCLADRGTRRFSLLLLRQPRGERARFGQLARHLRECLRSTDLMGRWEQDRLGILLTDTESAGTRTVTLRVESAVAEHGLRVEAITYIYPVVSESDTRNDAHGNGKPHDGGHSNGRGTTGREASRAPQAPPRNGYAHHGNGVNLDEADRHRLDGDSLGGDRAERPPVDEEVSRATVQAATTIDGLPSAPSWRREDLWPLLSAPTPLGKRLFDLLLTALALVFLLPLFGLLALAIRLDSPGPVLFKQRRAGVGARPFTFYKFRSMFVDAEERRAGLAALNEQTGPIFKIHDDPRITRVGRLLRRWSLDELPQLWNILKGDISIVGPRSPTFDEVVQYERWQRRRLNVIGGVTCIWQVTGRSLIGFEDWMRLDMRYIARRGFWLDLWVLARTLPAVLRGHGAY